MENAGPFALPKLPVLGGPKMFLEYGEFSFLMRAQRFVVPSIKSIWNLFYDDLLFYLAIFSSLILMGWANRILSD